MRKNSVIPPARRQSVGLFGYGAFGQLIATHLAGRFDFRIFDARPVAVTHARAEAAGLEAAAGCDIVIIATPVREIEALARRIAPHLKPGSLVLDVGSVKLLPAQILARELPATMDLICTHPLFGPQSAAPGLKGLKIVLCPVRGRRLHPVRRLLHSLGLEVIVATPEEHDRQAAVVQGLTHLIAKVLVQMEPLPTAMTTRSFDLLMQAVEMVRHDAPSVFLAIERDNPFARSVREDFFRIAAELDVSLSDHS